MRGSLKNIAQLEAEKNALEERKRQTEELKMQLEKEKQEWDERETLAFAKESANSKAVLSREDKLKARDEARQAEISAIEKRRHDAKQPGKVSSAASSVAGMMSNMFSRAPTAEQKKLLEKEQAELQAEKDAAAKKVIKPETFLVKRENLNDKAKEKLAAFEKRQAEWASKRGLFNRNSGQTQESKEEEKTFSLTF